MKDISHDPLDVVPRFSPQRGKNRTALFLIRALYNTPRAQRASPIRIGIAKYTPLPGRGPDSFRIGKVERTVYVSTAAASDPDGHFKAIPQTRVEFSHSHFQSQPRRLHGLQVSVGLGCNAELPPTCVACLNGLQLAPLRVVISTPSEASRGMRTHQRRC